MGERREQDFEVCLAGGLLFCRNKREEVSASKTDLLFFLKKVKFQKFYRVENRSVMFRRCHPSSSLLESSLGYCNKKTSKGNI